MIGTMPDVNPFATFTEKSARQYILKPLYNNVFGCPICGSKKTSEMGKGGYFCRSCRKQSSLTTNTNLKGLRIPLVRVLSALWVVARRRGLVNAVQLQKHLGGVSNRTSLRFLRTMYLAMQRNLEPLQVSVGAELLRLKSRSARSGKATSIDLLFVYEYPTAGAVRISVVSNVTDLPAIVASHVSVGSKIYTKDVSLVDRLQFKGYEICIDNRLNLASKFRDNLERYLKGCHGGAVSLKHLQLYLSSFCYLHRLERTKSTKRRFDSLLRTVFARVR